MSKIKDINHLVIVSPSFPKDELNDIVVPPLNLYLRELKRLYPKLLISVVTIHFPFHNNPYQVWNINVYPSGGANGSIIKRPLIWKKATNYLKSIHRKKPIDLVQSFWLNESPLIADKFCRKNNIPHFCTLMGQDAKKTNNYLRFFKTRTFDMICLSKFQKTVLEQNSVLMSSHVVPWGVVKGEYEANSIEERPFDLICVSSLIPLKRVEIFIDLVHKLKETCCPNINAIIVGGGSLKNQLNSKINQLNLQNNIQLLGLKPRKDVLSIMKKSKILVHTSSYEAQGYVLNEALAAGCYVRTLSNGLEVDDTKFEIHTESSMLESIKSKLRLTEKDYTSSMPITMLQTIEKYNSIFMSKGLRF